MLIIRNENKTVIIRQSTKNIDYHQMCIIAVDIS